MFRFYKTLSLTLVAVLALIALVPMSVSAQDQVELKIMMPLNELSDEQLEAFEAENPDIDLVRVEGFDDPTVLNAMLAADAPPDIIRTSAFAVPRLVKQGILLDITPYLEASEMIDISDLAPANSYFVVDGAYYGMAKDWSPDFSLFINNVAFEEAGLDIPSATDVLTYEQVGELARQLTVKEGDRTLRYGYGYGFLERQVQLMLAETGGSLYSEDFKEIHIMDNPEVIKILRWFYDLAVDGAIPTPLDPAASWTGQTFMDGQYGIISYGYWFTGMVNGATEESPVYEAVTMVPGASWTGETRYNPTWGPSGITIAAASNHPDEAFRFFEWYNAGDPALGRASSGWGVPALNSLQDLMPTESPFQQAAYEQVQNEMAVSDFVIPVNPYYDVSVFNSTWDLYLEDALRGTIDFDELIEMLELEVNAAIRDGVIAFE